ncbi:MAG: P-loop NTPase [Acidimicrobiia bacterium]
MAETGSVLLVVVDPDPGLRKELGAGFGERSPAPLAYPGVDPLLERLHPGQPAVVLCGPGLSDGPGLRDVGRLVQERPDVGVILMAPDVSTALLRDALRAGVKDVLAHPADPEAFAESVGRVQGTLRVSPAAAGPGERGRCIAVASMKGGSGKSVVATNLAAELARRAQRPVALLDADLQFGDAAVLLRLMPSHTLVEAIEYLDRLDAQLLEGLLARHEATGLYVLAAPPEPAFADRVTGAQITKIIEVLLTFCAYVVVDTPTYFNDVVLSVIEHADDVVLVAGMDIPSIKNVKLGLQTLRLIGVDESRIKLVLNRVNSKVKLDVASVERTLGIKSDVRIPSDIAIPESVNKGVPVLLDAPKNPAARSFEELGQLFLSETAEVPIAKTRSRFGLF